MVMAVTIFDFFLFSSRFGVGLPQAELPGTENKIGMQGLRKIWHA
jgi:hypothetical protein